MYHKLSYANLLSSRQSKIMVQYFKATTTISGIGKDRGFSYKPSHTSNRLLHLLYKKGTCKVSSVVLGQKRENKETKTEKRMKKICMCCAAATSASVLNACLYVCMIRGCMLSSYAEVSSECVCVCVSVCLLSQHLNDIKALCKLSPWQLFRIPSPLSV